MPSSSKKYHRRSIRLKHYDYTGNGDYFITLCTQNRRCLFGQIVSGVMKLNPAGQMIQDVWNEIPLYYSNVQVDTYQIMPNHFHAIVTIVTTDPDSLDEAAKNISLPAIVQRFKTMTTTKYSDGVRNNNWKPFNGKLWQRNYYEHIIRNDISFSEIVDYIHSNPANWAQDSLFSSLD